MGEPVHRGREAFDRQEWGEAYRELSAAAAGPLVVEDLDRLATAAYLTGRDEEGFALWARAHGDCLGAGDLPGAARFGVRLAHGLGFKGDIGRSSGWVDRARRLLDEAGIDCVEHGYLDHAAGMCRIFEDGDVAAAHACFRKAAKAGERFRDRELTTLARIGEGRCLVYLGEIAEGLALLDEAMVSVESQELSAVVAGDAYCTVIDACHELFDVRRCEAWTESFTKWCDSQPDLVLYRGHCRLHRAELMQLRGAWPQAVAEAEQAVARLAEPRNLLTLGGAHYVEGELHRLRGRFAEAEEAYRKADGLGCQPQPGLALLRLGQGRIEAADAAIRRVLSEADGAVARARILGPYVEIVLAAGDVASAGAAAADLTALADELGSPFLRAAAAHATGAVLLAGEDPRAGLAPLRRAWRGWGELRAPYEAARTRVLIAAACRALGDDDGAELELGAARTTFEQLGAGADLARLEAQPVAVEPQAGGGLTPREAEVLALVARGKTNRGIARDLFISEKTVASHVSHILTKLGLPSRAAATAYAYEHGVVRGP